MLSRSNFVVLCLCRNTELPEFLVEFVHVSRNSFLDVTEVVVFKFLTLWRLCTEKCSACDNEVFTFVIKGLVYEEVFLFSTCC